MCPGACKGLPLKRTGVTVKRAKRLFNKNTGLCKVAKRRIGSDACPVLEG